MSGPLPNSDVVVDGFCTKHGEVDVDPIARGDPDAPHTVLEVGILCGVSRRIDGPIHGGDVPPT